GEQKHKYAKKQSTYSILHYNAIHNSVVATGWVLLIFPGAKRYSEQRNYGVGINPIPILATKNGHAGKT
ncbi:hypothetical protein IJG90_01325, partial [Candidatus Saccharibacteria bacterium]|nr:hypothetical protein [Candidatus Saccharibacteria bacterium]